MTLPVIVKLTFEEKKKLINFLQDREKSYSKRIITLTREYNLVEEVGKTLPKGASAAFIAQLTVKIKEKGNDLTTASKLVAKFKAFINFIEKGDEFNGTGESEVLMDFYHREKESSKKLDKKYDFYPRLKRAKEASLYELANKIKTIMEYPNVQIA